MRRKMIATTQMGKLGRDQRGVIAIMTALLMPLFAGALALVIDIGYWRYLSLSLQKSADATAVALQYNLNSTVSTLKTQYALSQAAVIEAAKNGCSAATECAVTVNMPPKTGAHIGDTKYVEVLLQEKAPRLFSAIWQQGDVSLNARSVATSAGSTDSAGGGSGCILALNQWASPGINIQNQGIVYNQTCELYSDSNSDYSFNVSAQSHVWGIASAVGKVYIQTSTQSWVGLVQNKMPYVPDPYASLVSLPQSVKPSNCSDPNGNQPLNWNGGTLALKPGRYCYGFNMNGGTLSLAPGIYYFDSNVNLQNRVSVNGTGGVTMVLSPNSFGQSNWNNGTTFNLVAPKTGPTAGIVFMSFTDDKSGGTIWINNGVTFNYTGAIYTPSKQIYMQSGSKINSIGGTQGCGQIVADTVVITSNMTLGNQCNGIGVVSFGSGATPPQVPPSGKAGSNGSATQAGAGPTTGSTSSSGTSTTGTEIVE